MGHSVQSIQNGITNQYIGHVLQPLNLFKSKL
jgi:hypothetical protein